MTDNNTMLIPLWHQVAFSDQQQVGIVHDTFPADPQFAGKRASITM